MSATFKKWEKAILGSVGAILLAWSGWALSNTFVRNYCSQRINELGARVDTVEKTQNERKPLVDAVPVLVEKISNVEAISKENQRDLKDIRATVSRLEGVMSKAVAASRPVEE